MDVNHDMINGRVKPGRKSRVIDCFLTGTQITLLINGRVNNGT
jgi:hypothetical protein